jgi:hypothetical protein
MKQDPKQDGARGVNDATHAQGSESALNHPGNSKPWEDRSVVPEQRFKDYKEFVARQLEAIKEAMLRVDGDISKGRLIQFAPETRRWKAEAAELSSMSAEDFCGRIDRLTELRALLGRNLLGADGWRSQGIEVGSEPPVPTTITTEFLNSECSLHPRKRIKDTHLLVLVPKTVNDEPYTPLKLDEICATRKGSGSKLIFASTDWSIRWKSSSWASTPQEQSEWVLLPTSDPDWRNVPGEKHFRLKSIGAQQKIHERHYPEYRQARTVELMTAMLLNDLVNGEPRMLDGSNQLRCIELDPSGGRVCVGRFDAFGLAVHNSKDSLDMVGLALARKL